MTLRRLLIGALFAAALAAVPPAAVTVAQPPGWCPPGETGTATTCAPFCLPGMVWDNLNTGLCLPAAPPPPPPPPAPMNGVVTR
jgi:hypothetical protein